MRLSLNVDQETFDSAGRSFEPVPVGRYKVSIFSIVPDEVKSGDNKGKPRLKFQFRIAEGETSDDGQKQTNRRLFADINAFEGISQKTNTPTPPYDLVAIAKAMGAGADELDDIDTDDWLGEEMYVDVTWEEKKTKESNYKESFSPKQYREKVRGFRSVDSVETSVAATASVTAKTNTGAKAGVAPKATAAKKQLIKL